MTTLFSLGGLLTVSLVALTLTGGCAEATGSVQGGQPLHATDDGGGEGGSDTTWTALYADYFGPNGTAGCSAMDTCHQTASQTGAMTSGFVCGSTKDACFDGLTKGIPADEGGFFPPIAPPDAGNPAQTQLIAALHKASASGLNNMPCGNPPDCPAASATYMFTADDIARITTWMQQGAQDN